MHTNALKNTSYTCIDTLLPLMHLPAANMNWPWHNINIFVSKIIQRSVKIYCRLLCRAWTDIND